MADHVWLSDASAAARALVRARLDHGDPDDVDQLVADSGIDARDVVRVLASLLAGIADGRLDAGDLRRLLGLP